VNLGDTARQRASVPDIKGLTGVTVQDRDVAKGTSADARGKPRAEC
jgi:hypothetical protein